MVMRSAFAGVVAGLLLMIPAASRGELPDDKIKIGILQDLPQPLAGETGNGGIVAAQLAAGDFETEFLKGDAEILPGATDGSAKAVLDQVRDWLDKEHVAAVLSSAGPVIDRQIARLVEQRHRTLLVVSTDADLAGALCSPDAIIWGAGPSARARALAQALVPHDAKRWLVLTDGTPAGIADQAALQDAVTAAGGQVVGTIGGIASGADLGKAEPKIEAANPRVVALTQSGGDFIDVIRGARTASLMDRATFTAPHVRIADIDQAGLAAAEGLVVVSPFYWDANADTRRFARNWDERMPGSHVTDNAAEVYAATSSFLHAAKAVEDVDADKVVPELRRAPIKGTLFGTVTIRTDGRVVQDLGVYRVKQPSGVQRRWAYYDKLVTIPGAAAFPSQTCRKP